MTLDLALQARLGAFELDVNFSAPQGVTVLFGPSGSGKTSIIKAVAGLQSRGQVAPLNGRIVCNDRILFDSAARINLAPHQRRMGVVFQDARLFSHLTVQQNLVYGRWFAAARPRSSGTGLSLGEVADLLGLGPLLNRRPAGLSGGEAARVAIGRALLSCPEMLLADEPLAALDEARRAEILPYFAALAQTALVPMLYVTHSISEAAQLATTVVAMQNGRVLATGSAADIFGRTDVMGTSAATLIGAKVACQHSDGLTELATQIGPIFVPRINAAAGKKVQLRIGAQDVLLARQRPAEISALNILYGTICALSPAGDGAVMVTLKMGPIYLSARVTQRSAQAMSLDVGQDCFAIIKSVALSSGTL